MLSLAWEILSYDSSRLVYQLNALLLSLEASIGKLERLKLKSCLFRQGTGKGRQPPALVSTRLPANDFFPDLIKDDLMSASSHLSLCWSAIVSIEHDKSRNFILVVSAKCQRQN